MQARLRPSVAVERDAHAVCTHREAGKVAPVRVDDLRGHEDAATFAREQYGHRQAAANLRVDMIGVRSWVPATHHIRPPQRRQARH